MNLEQMLVESTRRSSALHGQFLQSRGSALRTMHALIEDQMRRLAGRAPAPETHSPVLFTSRQLDEFGTGRISDCLGPDFARYDGRRIPRIPNGALKMMSRITAISGVRGDLNQPAAVTAEYDVPAEAWYYRDNAGSDMPTAVLMEIALQPCGFLSAYLDTYAVVPYGDFYFRNLDGSARLLARMDLRGKTITTRARLLAHFVSGGTVVQKFAFDLEWAGQPLYQGESTFGYFPVESMANQVGLDGGRSVGLSSADAGSCKPLNLARFAAGDPALPSWRLSGGWLNLLEEVSVNPGGGKYGQGYARASRAIDPNDWFYPFHFAGDPVMPGSLGVEAIFQTVQAFALSQELGKDVPNPSFGPAVAAAPFTWRYRGQITPRHKRMELEVHFRAPDRRETGLALLADASLWVDGLRIYEIKNAGLGVYPGR